MSFFNLPFFSDSHRNFALELGKWAKERVGETSKADEIDVDAIARSYVRDLGKSGWLRYTVPAAYGGITERLDVRSLCIARETLGSFSGLLDFAFAMQGLGAGPISLFGSTELKGRYLPRVATGEAIAAFAISETHAGSYIAAMKTTARLDGNSYVIDGEKTWISNAGIADFHVVFCRLT